MKILVKLTEVKLAKHPVRVVRLVVLPADTLGGATWRCSAHLSSTWSRLPRLPIPSSRLIQRQEGESNKSEPCCARRSSRIRQSPNHTIGSTIVPSMQTRIDRFTTLDLISITIAHAPLRGVGPMGPDIMIIGVQSATLTTRDPTQEGESPSEESTGVEPTAMAMIWIVRVAEIGRASCRERV